MAQSFPTRLAGVMSRATLLAARWTPVLVLSLTLMFFAVRALHGIWFLPFVDESEHIIGGMMLNHGAILYRSFIDAHGPVTFMLTQAYGAVFGWEHPNFARIILVALALMAAGVIAASPGLQHRMQRIWAASLFLGLIASVWLLQALYMVNYHAIAGCFLATALACWVVPTWRLAHVRPAMAGVGGACFGVVIATAYSFGPALVLLAASSCWAAWQGPAKPSLRFFGVGAAMAILAILCWMLVYGDVAGYVVFHFIVNQFIYSKYLQQYHLMSLDTFITGVVPSLQPAALAHSLALICAFISLVIFLALARRAVLAPILLGYSGLMALCLRGGTLFQDGCFLVAAIALAALSIPIALEKGIPLSPRFRWRRPLSGSILIFAIIAGAELAMRHAITSPNGLTRAQMVNQPVIAMDVSPLPEYARIRALTQPNDRVLVLPYKPYVNLWADRLPMDKYTVYLPWDADYAQHPWFGHNRDLCTDMRNVPPKLVYFNNWIVWGRAGMADYAPCFIAILTQDYIRQTDFPNLYLRREHPA